MKSSVTTVFQRCVLMAAVLAVVIMGGCAKGGEDSSSADSEIDAALSSRKPVIIQFSSLENPCYKCTAMKVVLDEIKEIYQDRLTIVLVDFNYNRELAAEYEVMLVPTQLFYDYKGDEVFRHSGYMHIEDIISTLKETGLE